MLIGKYAIILTGLCLAPVLTVGAEQPLPACALSGATSVMFNGKPALRLSDVINCPPELYEVVQSVQVEGQPMVQFHAGATDTGDCTATSSPDIAVEGRAAQGLGDVRCDGH